MGKTPQTQGHNRGELALPSMKVLMFLVFAVGCATESLATTEAEISKTDLEGDGFSCGSPQPPSATFTCTRCAEVIDQDGHSHGQECDVYVCTAAPVGSDCHYDHTYIPANTYDQDLNYWFEADAGTLYQSMQRVSDPGASNGTALYAGGGSTRQTFSAELDGTVRLWARVIAPSTSANLIYFQLDSGPLVTWEIPVATSWTWLPVEASWFIGAGAHTLRIYTGEVGVKIDRVLATASASFVPVADTYQAEAAAIVAPMQVGTQSGLPPTRYIWVPNGAGAGGLAQLEVAVPRAGHYAVLGRANAPTTADDSIYVNMLGDARTAWTFAATTASTWKWNRAPQPFAIEPFDVLEVARREDGTKLDKLVLTNDPGFVLVEPSGPILTQ